MNYVSWNEARKSSKYHYNGNNDTANKIANIFQELATQDINNKIGEIVTLKYFDYICDLDIFWEDVFDSKDMKLVISLFITYNNETVDNIWDLLISDIYKPNYLEKTMYEFILEYDQGRKLNEELNT